MKKKIYKILATEANDLKKIETEVKKLKIKDYVVFGKDTPFMGDNWEEPGIDVYTDKDTFMKLVMKLSLDQAWY
jgi:hypothetical protein